MHGRNPGSHSGVPRPGIPHGTIQTPLCLCLPRLSAGAFVPLIKNQTETIITESLRALEYLSLDNIPYRTATTCKLGIAYQSQGKRSEAVTDRSEIDQLDIGGYDDQHNGNPGIGHPAGTGEPAVSGWGETAPGKKYCWHRPIPSLGGYQNSPLPSGTACEGCPPPHGSGSPFP